MSQINFGQNLNKKPYCNEIYIIYCYRSNTKIFGNNTTLLYDSPIEYNILDDSSYFKYNLNRKK